MELVRYLDAAFAQLREAGMNMLRISGTMAYESDAFLDRCDAHGVLLWQDLMFANMDYPEDDAAFVAEAGREVAQQLARLQGRPAVAVVCGNSEGGQRAAMWGAPRARWTPSLFHERFARLAAEALPGVPYWPSSAHGGAFPHQADRGTSSYYGVGAYLRSLDDLRVAAPSFATECLGLANVPEDVIVDFSQFRGKTLILYNDAPAAFPARVPSYDYYTGAPDLRPVGAPSILPGYGPNTRSVMQVKIAANPAAPAFNLSKLNSAFAHKANGTGVFEEGQNPIIVGQSAYNSAYGTSFASSGNCTSPTANVKCDGYARINQQGGDPFTFDTLRMNANGTYPAGYGKVSIPLEPKAIHDEMNSSNFDEFGRMQAILGVEVTPATPGLQNVVLLPYVYSATELIDTTEVHRGRQPRRQGLGSAQGRRDRRHRG